MGSQLSVWVLFRRNRLLRPRSTPPPSTPKMLFYKFQHPVYFTHFSYIWAYLLRLLSSQIMCHFEQITELPYFYSNVFYFIFYLFIINIIIISFLFFLFFLVNSLTFRSLEQRTNATSVNQDLSAYRIARLTAPCKKFKYVT